MALDMGSLSSTLGVDCGCDHLAWPRLNSGWACCVFLMDVYCCGSDDGCALGVLLGSDDAAAWLR